MKIGEILVTEKLITKDQLDKALVEQQRRGTGRLGSILIHLGYIKEAQLVQTLGKKLHVPGIEIGILNLDRNIIKLVPANMALKHQMIPISRVGKTLRIAMVNPFDQGAIEAVRFGLGYEIEPVVAAEIAVLNALSKYYKVQGALDVVTSTVEVVDDADILQGADSVEIGKGIMDLDRLESESKAPAQQFVSKMLKMAVDKKCSDFHIEPYEKELRVRFRIDGLLHEIASPNFALGQSITTYIKLLGGMKPDERRRPQDGRLTMKSGSRLVDFRMAVIPTIFGEKIAVRVLDKSNVSFKIDELGMDMRGFEYFKKAIHNPYGIIIVSGPSGCGKTTTLYAGMTEINSVEINITTAEDPVEYILQGINQVQMSQSAGLTFALALRAYLRQDPNVIMVGEIRDRETAEIAVRASLTGHLVMSSVHSNTAAATVTRLIDMGVEPFLIASTLTLVVAQRLIKKTCPHCRRQIRISEQVLKEVGVDPTRFSQVALFKGVGCEMCQKTGYAGRKAIFEVMYMSPRLKELVLSRATTDELNKTAVEEGMLTLREHGFMSVMGQETDIEEVIKETAEL
ncbi:Flp pilus assembly complex ATPase component TadA [candidate division WOR-3 bacterium]|nr:Flp pilus assembly complex ATPase component TadA [candidate division WOR-3 bacterium]